MRRRTLLGLSFVAVPAMALPAVASPGWRSSISELRYYGGPGRSPISLAADLQAYLGVPVRPLVVPLLSWDASHFHMVEAFRTGEADPGVALGARFTRAILGDRIVGSSEGGIISAFLPSAAIAAILDAWKVL